MASLKTFYRSLGQIPQPQLIECYILSKQQLIPPINYYPPQTIAETKALSNDTERQPQQQLSQFHIEVWTTPCIVTQVPRPAFDNGECGLVVVPTVTESGTLKKNKQTKKTQSLSNDKNEKIILVNPGNPQLTGTNRFTYFPRGGPVPDDQTYANHSLWFTNWIELDANSSRHSQQQQHWQPLGYVSQWGGIVTRRGMVFPLATVDGLVHYHGGWKLRWDCFLLRLRSMFSSFFYNNTNHEICPIGMAVRTSAGYRSALAKNYDAIIHTTPPFFTEPGYIDGPSPFDISTTTTTTTTVTKNSISTETNTSADQLSLCYHSVLQLGVATCRYEPCRICIPLLGAGTRGFPTDIAINVAVQACVEWMHANINGDYCHRLTVAFGLLERSDADEMISAFNKALLGNPNKLKKIN